VKEFREKSSEKLNPLLTQHSFTSVRFAVPIPADHTVPAAVDLRPGRRRQLVPVRLIALDRLDVPFQSRPQVFLESAEPQVVVKLLHLDHGSADQLFVTQLVKPL